MFDLRAYLDDLKTVVNIDSNSYYPEGLVKVGDVFASIAEKFGLQVKKIPLSEKSGNLLEITNHGEKERYDVLMMGHMDTVQPVGSAKERPYSEDEKLADISNTKTNTYKPLVSGKLTLLTDVKDIQHITAFMEHTNRYSKRINNNSG